MRICYVCPDLGIPIGGRKGASAHVRDLVNALRGEGHEVKLLCLGSAQGAGLDVEVVEIPEMISVAPLAAGEASRLHRALRHVLANGAVEPALATELERWRPDLVYERYSPFAIACGQLARAHGLPHLLEVNAPLAREGTQYRRQALSRVAEVLERIAFDSAGGIVAVSEALRQELVDAGVDAGKIAVVPNGVDLERFQPSGPRACHHLAGCFVTGFVGSLRPWHGVETLLEGFRELASEPRHHLLVVGDGPLARLVIELQRELEGRVTFVGSVDHGEVPRYLRAMDVAVAPYPPLPRFYFSPLKVLEYLAAGRPIVASAIGQVEELIRHGRTGLLVRPGNASELVRAIRRLASNGALRRKLARNGAATARRQHGWSERARRITALAPCASQQRVLRA